MIEKFLKIYEKYFYIIILLFFVSVTYIGLLPLHEITDNSVVVENLVNINNNIFKYLRDYKYITYTLILFISSIYVFFAGNKKNKIILGIVLGTSLLTFINSISAKNIYFISLELRYIVSFPLFFVFLNVFEIFIKRNGKEFLENLLLKTIKIIVIYIGIIFLLGKITNLYCITYRYEPYGYSGRFKERNALSNVFVMIIPMLMYFFYSKKEYKTIFYIIIAIICALLIGTKSAYFAVYTSLILFILISIVNLIITKKINIKKLVIIGSILISIFIINDKLYTTQFIKRGIDLNTTSIISTEIDPETGEEIDVIEEQTDTVNLVLNGRGKVLEEVKWIYNHENLYTKIIGLGYYYPRYPYVIVELDFFDMLFKQGIVGLLLFISTVIYYIVFIIKNIINNFKKLSLVELLLPLSSIGMVFVASFVSGHVMFNYITIFFYSMIIVYFCSKTKMDINKKFLKKLGD